MLIFNGVQLHDSYLDQLYTIKNGGKVYRVVFLLNRHRIELTAPLYSYLDELSQKFGLVSGQGRVPYITGDSGSPLSDYYLIAASNREWDPPVFLDRDDTELYEGKLRGYFKIGSRVDMAVKPWHYGGNISFSMVALKYMRPDILPSAQKPTVEMARKLFASR